MSSLTALRSRGTKKGTVLRFTSSEAGTLSISFERRLPGKRQSTRRFKVVGKLSVAALAGRNRVRLTGKIRRRALIPAPYRLTIVERDAAGNLSTPVRRAFTIAAR